jgi:peptidoglycan/LPS O-acetylase OafA/YrhL
MIASSSALVAIVGTAAGLLIHAFRTFEFPKFLHERLMLLGGISYSLYLTHVPVGGRIVNLGRRYVSGPLAEVLLSLVALATCLAFAWLFYRVIEKPSIAFAKRIMAGARHGEGPADTRDTTKSKTGEAASPSS